jgi:hypothetical protein
MKRVWSLVTLALAMAILFVAPFARGAEGDNSAKTLFENGARAYQEGRYEDAVDLFLKAYALDPQPELLYNTAQAYERLGDVRNALRCYRDYLRQGPSAQDRSFVETRVSNLERRLREQGVQQVSVFTTPAGATVVLDGTEVGKTPWTGEAPSGRHTVVLKLAGYVEEKKDLLLTDRSIDLDVTLSVPPQGSAATPVVPVVPATGATPMAPPNPTPTTALPEPEPDTTSHGLKAIRPWTWAALGVGVAALGGSLTFEFLRKGAQSDAENAPTQISYHDHWETMHDRQTVARVLVGVGAAGVVAGGVLLYFDLSRGHASGASPKVGAGCGPGLCGATFATAF